LGSSKVDEAAIDAAVEDVKKFVYGVDEDFSTYKDGSFISRLRRGEVSIEQCHVDVQEVWQLCLVARDLTSGAFDPWAIAGGFDPSGYVKGWAADRVALSLVEAGCENVQVNAAGDLTLRGGVVEKGVAGPWKIGVVNPDNRQEVLRIFEINDGAIATSGTYERGAHIFDPHTGTIAIGAKSATVLGPDGGLTDALATALMVAGEDGVGWFGQAELAEYSAWAIDRHSGGAWGVGPAIR
jgi:thiamine biosynthesis lipoprotein